ncbi:MAG: hypothetical protein RMJ56_00565 [Gemmataceae bacterium]|nr:hypothetical protein [Gemmata sp.]MDW8196072.1 hypothetical protein [Gemmataceae bacterium]
MRRAFLAVAILLTAAVSPTFAGYIIIRVLLETTDPGPTLPGMPGPGEPGDFYDDDDRGGKFGNFPPRGSIGPLPPPGMGSPGAPTDPSKTPPDHDPRRSIVVIIPTETDLVSKPLDESKAFNEYHNPYYRKFVTHWYGRRLTPILFVDSTSIQLYEQLLDKPDRRKTYATLLRQQYQAWLKSKTDVNALYEALIAALRAGIIRDLNPPKEDLPPADALKIAQELLDVAAAKKIPLPEKVQRFVQAWRPMHEAIKTPVSLRSSTAENWKSVLDARKVKVIGHYALIYWDTPDSPPNDEVGRRATQLNDHFYAYFLWHATRGIVLPVPTKPLLVVLAAEGKQMRPLRQALDGLPMHTAAFYSTEHSLLVLSPERLDNIAQTFIRQNDQIFKRGLSRDPLLRGEIPKLDATGEKGSKPADVARASTLALVEKFFADDSEIAAVTAEGTRQLLFETGQLPQYVAIPHWLSFGAVSFFSRPRTPAYVKLGEDEKPTMAVALRDGYDLPNFYHHRYFRDLEDKKELNPNRAKLLEHVLTDAYFAGIKNGDDPDPAPETKKKDKDKPKGPVTGKGPIGSPGPFPGPGYGPGDDPTGGLLPPPDVENPIVLLRKKRERLTIKAQATAWALYYYLAQEKPAQLQQYLAELNKFPRDLPIDGRTAFTIFIRVFDLTNPSNGTVDSAKFQKFAEEWVAAILNESPTWIDLPVVIPEKPKDPDPKNPMTPVPKFGSPPMGPGVPARP